MASVQHTGLVAASCHENKSITTVVAIADITVPFTVYASVPSSDGTLNFRFLSEVHVTQQAAIATANQPIDIIDHSDASLLATVTVLTPGLAGTTTSVIGISTFLTTGRTFRITGAGASTGGAGAIITLRWNRL